MIEGKRILELRLTSALTGETQVSRVVIVLPSTRYEGYLRQRWVDITDSLPPEEVAAATVPSPFDGA